MEISALASGSNGNCFYLRNRKNDSAILIDAGISAKKISERIGLLGRNADKLKAVFITHEHSDHIRGADVLARKLNIPIFATKKTIQNSFLCSDKDLINSIKNDEVVRIAGLSVEAFPKSHSAADPVSYNIKANNSKGVISVITDLGFCCNNTIDSVADSNVLFLESNHDINMLENGPYPYHIKKWIKSDTGHLSNLQASLCVLEHATRKLKHVVLSHISKTNNTPEMALHTFNSLIKERKDLKPKITASTREKPTDIIRT